MAATVAAILLLAGGARAARPALTLEKQPEPAPKQGWLHRVAAEAAVRPAPPAPPPCPGVRD